MKTEISNPLPYSDPSMKWVLDELLGGNWAKPNDDLQWDDLYSVDRSFLVNGSGLSKNICIALAIRGYFPNTFFYQEDDGSLFLTREIPKPSIFE